jgi:uncharacterized membrane protein YjjP (DUF1212 family)
MSADLHTAAPATQQHAASRIAAQPAADRAAPVELTAHLAARVGRLLLMYGSDTVEARQRVTDVASDLGHEVHVLVTAEAVLVTVGTGDHFRTKVGHEILGISVDMGRLMAVEQTAADIRSRALAPDAADARLDAIETGPSFYPGFLVVAGVSVTAASLARLFDAAWPVVGAAFLAGAVSTVMRRALARRGINPIASAFAIAFVSGLFGTLLLRAMSSASPLLCLTAAGMILVPGVPLINGVRDLINGNAGNAMARLTMGGATVLAIGFALFLAAAVAGVALPVDAGPGSLSLPSDLLFSALAAVGFAMLFSVPPRTVWVCVVCGMASHGLRTALEHGGLDIAAASLIGAFAAGIIARFAARAYHVPAVAFAFPGIVAMIPGSYGFRAGVGGLHLMTLGAAAPPALVAETLGLAVTTAIMTAAIAIGLSLALSIGPDTR